MQPQKQDKKYKHLIAPQLSDKPELQAYEESFRRWLAAELDAGRISLQQAAEDLKIPYDTIKSIRQLYRPDIPLTLPAMTEAEKAKVEKLQQRIKELEKQLEKAQITNLTLNTLIDISEKDFKIPIRKKGGAKQ